MVVLTQGRKSGVLSLHVGAGNVRQFFPRHIQMVELELDHLRIVCTLDPTFWQDRPEIHDTRLSLWLESKRHSGKLPSHAAPVALIPSGESSFRLQLSLEEPVKVQPVELAEATVPSTGPPSGQVERRAAPRRPVMRELGRLNLNELNTEHPLAAALN
jgi:hypothetical protein